MNTENLVNKMQRLKLEFLGKLYNLAQYNTAERFKILEVGRELGVDNSTLMNIAQHLHVKGFVELDIGGGTSITDSGIQVVEEIFTMRKSTYFPPTVVLNYINNVNNSQIQQSGNQSNQTIYLNNVDIDKVKEIIRNIEQQIDELKLDRKLTDELKEYIIDL
ncbi:MAG: hypothetical protein H8E87_03870, partial [FCB group bacterium]|nr:hypothetical protein [FCB group bacterium]